MSKVRYQIFVSSTFTDLTSERIAVLSSLTRAGYLAVGMEHFPATSTPPWEFIKKMIDQSDFYILILRARYGSFAPAEGISFTEMEYNYAREHGKPIYAFLHEDPDGTPRRDTDDTPEAAAKLAAFREVINTRHGRLTWATPHDLAISVLATLSVAVEEAHAVGWVRADGIDNTDLLKQISDQQRTIEDLRKQLADRQPFSLPGMDEGDRLALSLEAKDQELILYIAENEHDKKDYQHFADESLDRHSIGRFLRSQWILLTEDDELWPTGLGWHLVDACRRIKILKELRDHKEGMQFSDMLTTTGLMEEVLEILLRELESRNFVRRNGNNYSYLLNNGGTAFLSRLG